MTDMEKLKVILEGYRDLKLYGEIVIKYEAGKIVVVKKTESVKL